jgi:hypothetical protein
MLVTTTAGMIPARQEDKQQISALKKCKIAKA